jgi:plasmid stabilization system protein ParE
VKGTRELVVRPNYVMVYRVLPDAVEFLRVLHATQQWPAQKKAK